MFTVWQNMLFMHIWAQCANWWTVTLSKFCQWKEYKLLFWKINFPRNSLFFCITFLCFDNLCFDIFILLESVVYLRYEIRPFQYIILIHNVRISVTYSKSLFSSEGPKEVCYKNVLCFLKRSKCPQKIQHLLVPSEFLRFPQVTLYLPNFSEHKKNHESILLATQNCFNQYNIYSCATRTIFC